MFGSGQFAQGVEKLGKHFSLSLQLNLSVYCLNMNAEKTLISLNLNKMAYEFNDGNFKSEVLETEKVVLVDLWAEWCGPCKAMGPIVDELATEFEGKAVIGKLNVDDNPNTPTEFSVRGIPTFLIFKDGTLQERLVGTQTKQMLKDKIDALLA